MATRDEIFQAIRNADAAGDRDSVVKLGQYLQTMDAMPGGSMQPPKKPASALSRFAGGVAEPMIGVGQLIAHGAAMLPSQTLKDNAATYDQFVNQYEKNSAERAPEGWNVARGVGAAAPTLLATAGFGAPASMAGVMGTGAAVGGASAAAAPVDTSQSGFAGQKAVQTVVGTALGAFVSPIAQKAVGALGEAGAGIVNAIRRNFGQQASPQQIQVIINQALHQQGIDPSQVAPAFMAEQTRAAQAALNAGGTLDARSLANQAAASQVGAKLTAGQASQDPTQFSKEVFLRQQSGGAPLAQQFNTTMEALGQRIGDIGRNAAPATTTPAAGQQVINALSAADQRGAGMVRQLYKTVGEHPEADRPIDFKNFAQSVADQLYRSSAFQALPASLRTPIENSIAGKGAQQAGLAPTIRTADDINHTISGEIAKARAASDGSALHAIGIYKKTLDEAIGDAAKGSTVAPELFAARGAAAQRFRLHEAIPALGAVARKEVAPDEFMAKFVYNSNLADFQGLSKFVQQASPATWQQIRGQVIGDLQRAANPTTLADKFNRGNFSRELQALTDSGKLPVLFSKAEISQLQAIRRVADLVQHGPGGQSYTGFGGAAKAQEMLGAFLSKLGAVGKLGAAGLGAGKNWLEARSAIAGQPVARPAINNLIPAMYQNQLGVSLGQAAGAGSVNALSAAYANGR